MGDFHPLDPVGSFEVCISVARQHSPQKIAHVAIVLDDQDAPLQIGTVLCRFRDWTYPSETGFPYLTSLHSECTGLAKRRVVVE